jgi:hypothetical protein
MSARPLFAFFIVMFAACTSHDPDQEPGDPAGAPDAAAPGEGGGGDGDAPDAGDGDLGGGAVKAVLVRPGETDNAELVKRLAVARSETGATRRVVMRLGPDDIPDLAPGDRLSAPAEVEVTTRCDVGQVGAGCGYNPNVAAKVILTGNPDDTSSDGSGSLALSDKLDLSCTSAEHHCLFVFPVSAATRVLEGGAVLPCVKNDTCVINLVMWAWDPASGGGSADEILVGENEGDYLQNGVVAGDKGRLMVIRERGIAASDREERETSGTGSLGIPITATPKVLYSHPLKPNAAGLKKDEQYVVEAKVVTAVSSRARFSTRMFLTHDKGATDGHLDNIAPTSIGEHNGHNCTDGTSPCTTRKVSVFRAEKDIAGPVYVNIVGISEVPGGGSATVTVRKADGYLRSTRYAPSLKK